MKENQHIEWKESWRDEYLKLTSGLEPREGTTPITTPISTPISTRDRLLPLILAKPDISQQELAVALGLTRDGIKYHLNKMKRDGMIRHVGPSRGGRWEVLK